MPTLRDAVDDMKRLLRQAVRQHDYLAQSPAVSADEPFAVEYGVLHDLIRLHYAKSSSAHAARKSGMRPILRRAASCRGFLVLSM